MEFTILVELFWSVHFFLLIRLRFFCNGLAFLVMTLSVLSEVITCYVKLPRSVVILYLTVGVYATISWSCKMASFAPGSGTFY